MADYKYEDYVTKQGDSVDLIAFERFGTSSGTTERILDANPGLADYGPILPMGLVIKIPVPTKADRAPGINIWS